jgi:hypothetical protein
VRPKIVRRAAALVAAALLMAGGTAARATDDPVGSDAATLAPVPADEPYEDDPEAVPVTQTPQTIANTFNLQISPRFGAWTHDRELNGQTVTAVGSVRARISPVYGALDGYAEGYVQAISEQGTSGDLVEAWMRVTSGAVEVKAGREIIVWGRADGLNPTDIISSRDYTLLVANDDEQRRGNMMIQGRVALGDFTVDAFWLPEFRPNIFPIDTRRPGVAIVPDQIVNDNDQFAFKLDRSGGTIDWSLSWFHGTDRTRDFVRTPVTPPGALVGVQQRYPRIDMFGADMAGTSGSIGYRAEIAFTAVAGPDTIYRKNSNIWLVAGIDTNLESGWHLSVQYSFRYIFDFRNLAEVTNPLDRAVALQSAAVNNQLNEVQNGATFSANRSFWQDTLTFQFQSVVYFETGDAAIMPQLTYSVNDRVRVSAGADVFLGPQLSYFGRVRSVSGGFVQVNFGF